MSVTEMPPVSVIVPVYNVEAYLRECLDSIIAQDYENLEVIMVDDCSADSSLEICREYARRDKRFHVVENQMNSGPSFTRNRGLAASSGEWIVFLDSDDLIAPYGISHLLEAALENDADIVQGGFRDFSSSVSLKKHDGAGKGKAISFSFREALIDILYQQSGLNCSVCGKIFRRSIFDDIRFSDGILYEDMEITFRILSMEGKFIFLEEDIYFYRDNPASIIHTFSRKRGDVLRVMSEAEKRFREDAEIAAACRSRMLSAAFNIYALIVAGRHDYPEMRRECENVIRSHRASSLRDSNVRMKNKIGSIISYAGGFPLLRFLARIMYK